MGELFSNLGIDAKILAAQIINFAILLLILQKFAYKPIIKMLNSRREEIEKASKHASEIDARIRSIEQTKEAMLSETRAESSELIKNAERNAAQAAERIVADAKAEATRSSLVELKKIEQKGEKLREDLRKEIGEVVATAIEKSVGDILDKSAKEKFLIQALEKARK